MKKPGVTFFLILFLFLFSGLSEALNPNLSRWTINLSESDQPTEPADPDLDPQVIVSGNTIHVLWTARNADWSGYKLYYRRSVDGGRNWQPKVLLMSDPDNFTADTERRMAVDGNNVHVFQRHYGNATDCVWIGVLTYFRSTDNGATFDSPVDLIHPAAPNCGWHVKSVYASASGGSVTVGYRHAKNDGPYTDVVSVLTSSDNGATFTNHSAMQNDDDLILEDMAVNGSNIFLLYRHVYGLPASYSTGSALYMAASVNGGSTFKNTLISMPSNMKDLNNVPVHQTGTLQDYHYSANLAVSGSTVSAVWSGIDSTGTESAFYRRSTDNGTSFEAMKNLSKPVLPSGRIPRWGLETIAAKDNYVYVVFVEDGTSRVLFRGSSDGGATFGALKELTKEGITHIAGGWWPVAVADPADVTGATVHVFWTGPRYVISKNGGASFSNPVMIATNFTSSSNDRPQMAVGSDGVIHFAMEGINRAGYDSDIFYRRFNPVAPAPAVTDKAIKFRTDYLNGDIFLGIYDNMQVKATADTNFKGAMTAEAWVKVNRDPDTEGYFIHKEDPGAGGAWGSYMLGQWRSGQVDARITTTDGTTMTGWVLVSGDPLPNGVWTHIAMTYDAAGGADNFRIYVNGAPAGTMSATGTLATDSGILFIGGDSSNRYHTDVVVDDLRLWNRALSQAEIRQYMSGTAGTESGLRAYYNFNGTTKDITGHGNDGVLMYQETYTAGQAAPAAPSGLMAKPISKDKIVLSWKDKSLNEKGFEIDRAAGACTATSWTTIARLAQDAETYTNSGLTANTAYAYRVRAYNSRDSANSNCVSAKTFTAGTPNAPTGLRAVSAGSSRVNLSWSDASGNETGFRIFRKAGASAWQLIYSTGANVKSYSDNAAPNNTDTTGYQYYLKACAGTLCSDGSSVAVVPFAPAALNAAAASSTRVDLTWTGANIGNETGFEIQRSDTDCAAATSATWKAVGINGANAVSYSDIGVAALSTYAYRVRALAQSAAAPYATGYSLFTACSQVTTP